MDTITKKKEIKLVFTDKKNVNDTLTNTIIQPSVLEIKSEHPTNDWFTIILTLAIGAFLSQIFTYFSNKFSDKKKKEKRLNDLLFMMLLHVKQTIDQTKYLIDILSSYEEELSKKKQLIEKTIASPPLNSNIFKDLDKTELFDAFGLSLLDLEQFYMHVDELKNKNPTQFQRSFMGTIEKYKSEDEHRNNIVAEISLKKTLLASKLARDNASYLLKKGEEIIKKHSP
jgi:hypothetical protein